MGSSCSAMPPPDVLIDWRTHNNAMTEIVQRVTAAGAIAPGWPAGAVRLNYAWINHVSAADGAGGLFEAYEQSDIGLERTRGDAVQLPNATPYSWPVGNPGDLKLYPGIASDGAGGCYVGWAGQYFGATWYWVLNRMQSDGTASPDWPAEGLPVGSWTSPPAAGPVLSQDPMGGVYVGWVGNGVRLKRYNGEGTLGAGWPSGGLLLAPTGTDVDKLIALVPSGSDHVIAMWNQTPSGSPATRVLLKRIGRDHIPDPAWPVSGVELMNSTQPIKSLGLVSDGQGDVWAFWETSSTPFVRHFQSSGTPTFLSPVSPLDAAAQYVNDLYAVHGRDDGLIVGWTDSRPSRPGVRLRWIRSDGTPDPAEPDSARAASPHYPPDFMGPLRAFNRGLLDDGQGGAYVAWDYRAGPLWELVYLGHLGPSSVLGVAPGSTPRAALALRSVTPNPAAREVQVRFTLAEAGPARLELLDISGRLVRSLEVPGARSEQVARFEDLGRLLPGLYVVRLAQGGSARSARVAIVR